MIKKYFAVILGAILLVMASVLFFVEPADAAVIDDLTNSTFSGYVMLEDRSEVMFENITIFEPKDESLFGVPLTLARYKIVSFGNDDMVDDLLLIGSIGQSDTFYLSYRKLDEPFNVNAGGILYDVVRHWAGEDAPPVYLGVYLMDNGKPLYTLYGKAYLSEFMGEGTNGYYFETDLLLGMEDWLNRDFFDGKFAFGKDTSPDGASYIEAFVYNISGATYYGAGAGFRF